MINLDLLSYPKYGGRLLFMECQNRHDLVRKILDDLSIYVMNTDVEIDCSDDRTVISFRKESKIYEITCFDDFTVNFYVYTIDTSVKRDLVSNRVEYGSFKRDFSKSFR